MFTNEEYVYETFVQVFPIADFNIILVQRDGTLFRYDAVKEDMEKHSQFKLLLEDEELFARRLHLLYNAPSWMLTDEIDEYTCFDICPDHIRLTGHRLNTEEAAEYEGQLSMEVKLFRVIKGMTEEELIKVIRYAESLKEEE